MSVAVTMRGEIEPIIIDGGFADAVNALNMTAAQGKEFIVAEGPDGFSVAMKLDNILTIKEVDDSAFLSS